MSDPTTPAPTVRIVDAQGNTYDVPSDQADDALTHLGDGAHVQSSADALSQANKEVWTKEASGTRALLGSALSGATLGASDAFLDPIQAQRDREAHSTLSTIGNIGGSLAPILLSGGASAGVEGIEGAADALKLADAADALRAGDAGIGAVAPGALRAIAGASPVALASKAGGAISEALGGGLIGRGVGGAVEGGLIGAGQGFSEAALSDDPLTAENIAGHISSNALLGAGIGGGLSVLSKGVESAFERAGQAVREAQATRDALTTIPEDLANLDEQGLKDSLKQATADHETAKAAEVANLETGRQVQRQALVKDVDALHEDMRSSKLYQAVNDDFANGAKPEAIDGITVAQKQLASANQQIGKLKLNPIGLADNTTRLLDGLQKQQAALETIQSKLPELRTVLADNPAGVGLDAVDSALERTKAQIDAIKALDSKLNPVNSPKLALMKAGGSARMEQVQAAQQALKDGKDLGIVGSKIKSIAQSAASGLTHFIPVPGAHFAGHFLGEKAGQAVEWLARKLTGTATKTAETTAGHASTFLDTASRVTKAMKAPAVATATHVLSNVRFAAKGQEVTPKSDSLRDLFLARSQELKQQTMYAPDGSVVVRPEVRKQLASTFDGIRGAKPVLADKLESVAAAKLAYQSKMLPRKPDPGTALQFGPDNWSPSELQMRSWARIVRATEDPESVERRLAHGLVTPEEAQAYKAVFPTRFAALQSTIAQGAPGLAKTLPMQKKIALSVFTGVPLIPALQPNVFQVLQATFTKEPGTAGGTQAPKPQPSFGKFGSLKSVDKPTPSQERQ